MSRHPAGDPILGRVMLAFEGLSLTAEVTDRLGAAPAAGVTLFRHLNVRSPAQVRALTDALQGAAGGGSSAGGSSGGGSARGVLLVAADQEAGQFIALGDGSTPFAGNMALGAVDDIGLTERVGRAIGTEARAMGLNVVYAPVLDVASNPRNPALGIRAFGDDPSLVGRHGAAMVRGLQSAGVAACVKHFPGAGEAADDPHHGVATVGASRAVLSTRELAPFREAVAAGARITMSAHVALPAVTRRDDLPATLSRDVMTGLLRDELGFEGVSITDALDMAGVGRGPGGIPDVAAAIQAGVDLLLTAADPVARDRIEAALVDASTRGLFDAAGRAASDRRLAALREWLASFGDAPDIDVVGGSGHQGLAAELATRSITLVRDPAALLPVPWSTVGRVLAVMPRPSDLTPADTSSTVAPALAAALRRYHGDMDEVVVEPELDASAIAAVGNRAAGVDLAVIGTIDAHRLRSQIELVETVAATGTPTIAVAMRGPWDVATYPRNVTALATYSILPGSLEALAAVLAGDADAPGHLPVVVAAPAA
jgi:beta-N-acetylhexosaminidase